MILRFGCLAAPIQEQLMEQGYTLSESDESLIEKLRNAINMVYIHGIVTEAQKDKMFWKLFGKIEKAAKEYKGEEA